MSWATPGESKKVKVSSGGGSSSLTSRTDANITSTVVSFVAIAPPRDLKIMEAAARVGSSSSSNSVDFDSVMSMVGGDTSQAPFTKKASSTQARVRQKIKNEVGDIFTKYAMYDKNDIHMVLDYIKNDYGELDANTAFREAVAEQLQSLPLSDRNHLIRLLTHSSKGEVNSDILKLFPGLEKRSIHLFENPTRKERADKIPLEFISEFMHNVAT
jgi:hypothetical protein